MPKKISNADTWPTLVLERLLTWGKCIQTQRLQQRIKAEDLCARLGYHAPPYVVSKMVIPERALLLI